MRRLRGDRGATAVEFALVAPVVLLLLASLAFFAFRGVYSGLAANSARNALTVAMLPQGSARTPVDPKEVYGAAVCAVPGALRPGSAACSDLRAVPVATGFGVQVCPPDCTFEADVDTGTCAVALPAATAPGRVRALALPGARVVPLAAGASPSPTRGGTFGGLIPTATPTSTPAVPSEPPAVPTATPSVPVPRVTQSVEATLTPGVPLSTPLPTPTPLPTTDPLPVPSPLPAPPPRTPTDRCLSDTAEGRIVIVRVTWQVPGLSGLLGLTGGVLSKDLATVSSTASGHRE